MDSKTNRSNQSTSTSAHNNAKPDGSLVSSNRSSFIDDLDDKKTSINSHLHKIERYKNNRSFNIHHQSQDLKNFEKYFSKFDWEKFCQEGKNLCDYISATKDEQSFDYTLPEDLVLWVQSHHPLSIYQAIQSSQVDERILALMVCISNDQFIRIIDLDVWQQDQISLARFVHWLVLYSRLSNQQMFQRFRALEEEYQISVFQPYITAVTPQQYEKLSVKQQDELYRFPADAYFYKIDLSNTILHDFCHYFIEALIVTDTQFALSYLDHLTWLPSLEAQSMALQFRNARNEEDGYFSYYQACKSLLPITGTQLQSFFHYIIKNSQLIKTQDQLFSFDTSGASKDLQSVNNEHYHDNFLLKVFNYISANNLLTNQDWNQLYQQVIFVTNHLISAQNLEPWQVTDHKYYLIQVANGLGMSLDILCQSQAHLASQLLSNHHVKSLINYGRNWASKLQVLVAKDLHHLGMIDLSLVNAVKQEKFTLAIYTIDNQLSPKLSMVDFELLRAVFNRYPLMLRDQDLDHNNHENDLSSDPTHQSSKTKDQDFNPLLIQPSNHHQFIRLFEQVASTIIYFRLAFNAASQKIYDGDQTWLKSIANISIGGRFINRVFDQVLVKKLIASSTQDRDKAFDDFIDSVNDYLGKDSFYLSMVELIKENYPCFSDQFFKRSIVKEIKLKATVHYLILEDVLKNKSKLNHDQHVQCVLSILQK